MRPPWKSNWDNWGYSVAEVVGMSYHQSWPRHQTWKRHHSLQVPPHTLPIIITALSVINGRLAWTRLFLWDEVGSIWRPSTLCCFYAWKAVWSLNRLPCCPVSPNLINHDIRLQSVYACIDRAFRFYFWGAGSRRKNPQSWISLSSSGRTMNGHNYSFFCSVKSK